jgi:glycosyltransferase involved in cell wall biosynthesis
MKLSVITPIYNRADIFERTLKSVVSQLDSETEYIIVSDGSDDVTALRELLSKYGKHNIVFKHYTPNAGTGHAINVAAEIARGDWLTIIGSDDEMLPGAINRLNKKLIQTNVSKDFFYFNLEYDFGEITPTHSPSNLEIGWREYLEFVESNLSFNIDVGICVRREVFNQIRHPENWAYENYFQLQINKKFSGKFESDVLYLIHVDAKIRGSIPDMTVTNKTQLLKMCGQREGFRKVLEDFGNDIEKYSPKYYSDISVKNLGRTARLSLSPLIFIKNKGMKLYLKLLTQFFSDTCGFACTKFKRFFHA